MKQINKHLTWTRRILRPNISIQILNTSFSSNKLNADYISSQKNFFFFIILNQIRYICYKFLNAKNDIVS